MTWLRSRWIPSRCSSPRGLVRHWWVLVKLALVVVATLVLMLQLAPIGALADTATTPGPVAAAAQWREVLVSLVVHASGGIVVLLAATVLAIYKPRGMTRYGQRRTMVRAEG